MPIRIQGSYFVVIRFPGGPILLPGPDQDDEDDSSMYLFKTLEDARKAARAHGGARAYGAEAFRIGDGKELIL